MGDLTEVLTECVHSGQLAIDHHGSAEGPACRTCYAQASATDAEAFRRRVHAR